MPWQIDTNHASIGFTGKHMLVSRVKGRFEQYTLELDVDEKNVANSAGVIRVNVASLNSGFDQRDEHLRSADFFNVEAAQGSRTARPQVPATARHPSVRRRLLLPRAPARGGD